MHDACVRLKSKNCVDAQVYMRHSSLHRHKVGFRVMGLTPGILMGSLLAS